MSILIISKKHNDINSVGSIRSRIIEDACKRNNYDCVILCSSDNKVLLSKSGNRILISGFNCNSSKYFFGLFSEYINKIKNRLGFLVRESYWEINVKNLFLNRSFKLNDVDLIISTYPSVDAIKLGLYFSRELKCKLLTDFRDGFLGDPLELGLQSTHSRKYMYYKKILWDVLKYSYSITAASDAISKNLQLFDKQYSKKIATIYNGFVDFNAEKISIPTKFPINILHTGRLSLSEPGTPIFKFTLGVLIAIFRDYAITRKFKISFIGQLSIVEKIILFPLILCNVVRIYPPVHRDQCLEFQSNNASSVSGKLIEYIAKNKPIWAVTIGTEAEDILKKIGHCFFSDPNDASSVANFFFSLSAKNFFDFEPDAIYAQKFSKSSMSSEFINLIARSYES